MFPTALLSLISIIRSCAAPKSPSYSLLIVIVFLSFSYSSWAFVPTNTMGKSEIVVKIREQKLHHFVNGQHVKSYSISTAARGIGNQKGSYRTPLGRHQIAQKIGDGSPRGTIFRGRQSKGDIAKVYTHQVDFEHDLILSRILWLDGLEPGINKGGQVDTMSRYIYIHGTDEEGLIGSPASEGCIRMNNDDVIELFDRVNIGTLVIIEP